VQVHRVAQPNTQTVILTAVHDVGRAYTSLLVPYKPLLVRLQSVPQLKETCVGLIDLLEGRRWAINQSLIYVTFLTK
jgi:hypothetical protein